ncbi:DUF2971 domain-containing protein [Flavobacterium sp. UMI-01]|uniref:DUF2971 domain-containing protein n=1 Tax=Flavobacterium sp. UMI-01 TaxID=1441053 RepID=UPI001C7DFB06|nr:DUF2971 domain-containing protein [Flavobacterium sp. UMI-01]GIZ07313.1 hypothetical protein FUMI01_00400 [Flavobacterium sp. UMI-01]
MKNYVPTVNIDWEFENYKYSHNFLLDGKGYISSITEENKEFIKPEFLYKFYSLNDYSLNSFLEGYLYFSNPKNFNDPFDCLVNREKYIISSGSERILRHRENIGVCCFTLENNNPLMWGHYANSYSGFCLKFENESSLLQNKNIAIKSHVAYLKDYKPANENLEKVIRELNLSSLDEEMKELIRKVLTMVFEYCWKMHDWKYEKEFRAISINSKSFDNKLYFDKNRVKEIYIGQNMKIKNPDSYKFLMRILKNEYPHIKIFEVKPHPLYVKLEFNEMV